MLKMSWYLWYPAFNRTVTVIVKGEPVVAAEGAEKLRIACGVAQPASLGRSTCSLVPLRVLEQAVKVNRESHCSHVTPG